jgi:hypothetical protein
MEKLIAIVGDAPTISAIDEVISQFALIFQQIAAPAQKTVSGLFGELFLIANATDATAAVQAWRNGVDDNYDFATPLVRLEVKSSGARVRSHIFSLKQCTPPDGCIAVLASIYVEKVVGGTSIAELINLITRRLGTDAKSIVKLQKSVAETLGSAIVDSLNMSFDELLAQQSLRYFDLHAIPAIRPPVPIEVSEVHFRSDLTNIVPLMPKDLTSRNRELARILAPL